MQNILESLTQLPFSQTGALIILDATMKGAIILSAAWLAARLLRRSSPSIRHYVWGLAFAALLFVPLTSTVAPAREIEVVDSALSEREPSRLAAADEPAKRVAESSEQVNTAPEVSGEVASQSSTTFRPSSLAETKSQPDQPSTAKSKWKPLFFSTAFWIWFVGAAFISARLMMRLAGVWSMARRSRPLKAPDLIGLSNRVAVQQNIAGTVSIYISDRVPVPLIWGIFRPVVLLPGDAESWPSSRVEMALHHEFAHVKRRDHIIALLVQLACALHWMNPLAWLAAGRIEVERERSCDDAVLQTGAKASEYARQLLAVASRLSGLPHHPGNLAMAGTANIERRLRAILDPQQKRGGLTVMTKLITLAFVLFISVPLTTARISAGQRQAIKPAATLSPAPSVETIEANAAAIEESEPAAQDATAKPASSPGLEAAQALEALGGEELITVARALRNQDWDARRKDYGPAQITNRRAVLPLMRALEDDNPVVRRIAAWTLGEIRDARAVQALRQRLSDYDADVRAQAAQSLGDIENREPVEDLMLALSDPVPSVRLKAAHALGDIRDSRSLPALTAALQDTDKSVRHKAEWAIRQVVEEADDESSTQYARHTSATVRERVAHEMGDRKDARSVPTLINLLWDESPRVRDKAAWALGEIGSSDAVEALVSKAIDEEEVVSVRRQAIRGLGEIGDPAAGLVLLRLLESTDWRLRSSAADALGDVGIKEAIEPLTRALNDRSESVRENARKALRKIR